jgi:hypothetical protein
MLPLTPRLERFHVLREERVGSREMLMLGNDAGARLLVPENARST